MPRKAQPKTDTTLLEMALIGYQSQLEQVSAKIAAIRSQLGQRGPGRPKAAVAAASPGRAGKRTMSASARARIAAAQKARWAAYRKGQSATPATAAKAASPKPKRRLSAAGRRAIIAATKKRWAAVRAAGAAAAQ